MHRHSRLSQTLETTGLFLGHAMMVFGAVYFLYAISGYNMDMPGAVILFWMMVASAVLEVANLLLLWIVSHREKRHARQQAEEEAAWQASRPAYLPWHSQRPTNNP